MEQNKILALKYRPQEFKELIGQEIIAQTITNAIKLDKTPNAYLLTGIRGVGKTTTARLIAKSLNCPNLIKNKKECSRNKFCETCKEISNSNHIDVLEMDAASKTGIDDVRELIENSKYRPTSAKFKIYIIDEVHMLSKQAFNGLLKTLEEPPPSLKFILATTEVRKIPVTILSRCQRFDLKRVDLGQIFIRLNEIAKKENGKISDEALKIIARASEGSVRDAISLLDRALIVQELKDDKKINETDIRQILGVAEKKKFLDLMKEILEGNEKKAIDQLREMISTGLDAKVFLNDILELLYLFGRAVSLGDISQDNSISKEEADNINSYSKKINMTDIGIFWQLTLKTIDDLRIVSNENLALEMYIMQLTHLKKIENPGYMEKQDSVKSDQKKTTANKNEIIHKEQSFVSNAKNQIKNTEQIKAKILKEPDEYANNKIKIKNFNDLLYVVSQKKEVELKFDIERHMKLVSFDIGKIEIGFNDKLNKNFIKNLTEKLSLWTGERWIISLSKKNADKSFQEKKLEQNKNQFEKIQQSTVAKDFFSAFPDAKLVKIDNEENND
mgnify:CR=1 FL=1